MVNGHLSRLEGSEVFCAARIKSGRMYVKHSVKYLTQDQYAANGICYSVIITATNIIIDVNTFSQTLNSCPCLVDKPDERISKRPLQMNYHLREGPGVLISLQQNSEL